MTKDERPKTMSKPVIRGYRPDDEVGVLAVWNSALFADPISATTWRAKVLLDPNFDREGCLIAEVDGEVRGFLRSLVRRVPFFGLGYEPEQAWITAFGVAPGFHTSKTVKPRKRQQVVAYRQQKFRCVLLDHHHDAPPDLNRVALHVVAEHAGTSRRRPPRGPDGGRSG